LTKKVHGRAGSANKTPVFSEAVSYGNLLFIAGKGAGVNFEGDIRAHTKRALDRLEEALKNSGSSMEKVLKVNVYLADLKDYQGMNEVYQGRFGVEPPARTTVSTAAGIPDGSRLEIDCVAYI
jgi:enamine deaminase RidA (YjgF/YER057c/UK114 family)